MRYVKSKLLQILPQPALRHRMESIQRQVGVLPAERHALAMDVQHGIVQIALGVREFAIHGPRARDVRDVRSGFL